MKIEPGLDLHTLLERMSTASFGARTIGRAWEVLKMVSGRPNCGVILTISGAMTVAKLGPILGELITRGIAKTVVTTGALVTHSLVEEMGLSHFSVPRGATDADLFMSRLNRIYDSVEPEENLEALEEKVRQVLRRMEKGRSYGSWEIVRDISAAVTTKRTGFGLLGAALNNHRNVFVPALTDSELGLYIFRYLRDAGRKRTSPIYDPVLDLNKYAQWLSAQEEVAFLTVGGGTPRNWAQQMLPYLRSACRDSQPRGRLPEVIAAVRICPDSAALGHLSGSTYSEAITWGKVSPANQGNFVEVYADATIVLPILVKALVEHRG